MPTKVRGNVNVRNAAIRNCDTVRIGYDNDGAPPTNSATTSSAANGTTYYGNFHAGHEITTVRNVNVRSMNDLKYTGERQQQPSNQPSASANNNKPTTEISGTNQTVHHGDVTVDGARCSDIGDFNLGYEKPSSEQFQGEMPSHETIINGALSTGYELGNVKNMNVASLNIKKKETSSAKEPAGNVLGGTNEVSNVVHEVTRPKEVTHAGYHQIKSAVEKTNRKETSVAKEPGGVLGGKTETSNPVQEVVRQLESSTELIDISDKEINDAEYHQIKQTVVNKNRKVEVRLKTRRPIKHLCQQEVLCPAISR